MSDFATKAIATAAPDPSMHVNYTYGMVLGVDDFNQEFAYLSGRDRWLARDLLGYGTVRGLQVVVEDDGANGPRVSVKPGVALSPSGQLICVPTEQCASLNAWLAGRINDPKKKLELDAYIAGTAPNESVQLHIRLCYRECPTANVPIPGEPCRTEDQATAPSRLQDDFRLELHYDPPDQIEELGLREYVDWLRRIPVDGTAPSQAIPQFLDAIRAAVRIPPPDQDSATFAFMDGAPPAETRIHIDDAPAYWQAAFRLWATEVRPKWTARGQQCAKPPLEGCVLIGTLNVPLTVDRRVNGDASQVSLDQGRRPYVLHLRLLQEWLLTGKAGAGMAGDKGPTGDPGPAGDKGPSGDPGPVGDKGPPGDKGPSGDSSQPGDKGPPGDQGPVGDKGPPGDPGSIGDKGPPGDQGPVGDKGPTGDQGPVGDKGPPGDPGSTGGSFVERPIELSLYGIAAAGLVRPDGSNHPFAVRELAGKVIAPGQAIFFFKGYTPPVETHQYVVKALLAYDIEFERRFELFSVSLIFDRFTDEGFVLRVLRGAQPVEEDMLARMGFMIEVSEYDTGLIRSAPPGATRTAAVRPAAKRRSRTARRSGK